VLLFLKRHIDEILLLANSTAIDKCSDSVDYANVNMTKHGNVDTVRNEEDKITNEEDKITDFSNAVCNEIDRLIQDEDLHNQPAMTMDSALDYNDHDDPDLFCVDSESKDTEKRTCTISDGVTARFPVEGDNPNVDNSKIGKRSFNGKNIIGNFVIDAKTWELISDPQGKLLTAVYPTIISDRFYKISTGCVVQMKKVSYMKPNCRRKAFINSGKHILTIYAYCGHNQKTTFKFVCSTLEYVNDVQVLVFTNAEECYHPKKKTRELSGISRDTMKHELINNSPTLVRLKCVNSTRIIT
jgi:hypothetical protein